MTPFDHLSEVMLPAIEDQLHQALIPAKNHHTPELYGMLAYHLGWEGKGAGARARGKRIRPLLVTLTAYAAEGSWHTALPAAAAVELLHNFSLIHDDIQDNSPHRRGRLTVWKLWGVPQAINAGDAMFTLAHMALNPLQETLPAEVVLKAHELLENACLALTQGQYLDISYETRSDLTLDAYWPMVGGKTAALLTACTELGALSAQVTPARQEAFRELGRYLGLAFQVQDDLLGIWGDAAVTGKSSESDLVAGKNSLPVLYGLSQDGAFAARWRQGPIQPDEVTAVADTLEAEGALEYTRATADELTAKALQSLENADPQGEGGEALVALANRLLKREV